MNAISVPPAGRAGMKQLADSAFNAGADARICGWKRNANPHDHAQRWERVQWDSGWADADTAWAKGVNGRWVYRLMLGVEPGKGANH